MKSWNKFLIVACSFFTITGISYAELPREGLQYTQLPKTIENAPEIIEFFSLTCSHCPKMEAVLPSLAVLTKTEINQEHVVFNESARSAAFIYYAMVVQMNGLPNRNMLKALFAYVQSNERDNDRLVNKKIMIADLFSQYGLLSPDNLPKEQLKLITMKMAQSEAVVNAIELRSIPALVVQGRYLVEIRAHKSINDLAETVNHLKLLINS